VSVGIPTEPLKFAYWVPNVSGGLVTSAIEQRTDWNWDYNRETAIAAENNGFEYALSQVRYMASYSAEYQHESTSLSLAIMMATERLKVMAAVHPGMWHPGVFANFGATADHLTNGRFATNVVSGWFKGEFTAFGEPWLEHDERPHPTIFQGGNSTAAQKMAGRVSDFYFSNGKDFDGVTEQLDVINATAAEHDRTVGFGLNGFMIVRDTEKEARDTLREIVAKANVEQVKGFRDAVQQAGASAADKKGMWADSSFSDLVQYNDGFKTQLIGTAEQVAERLVAYKKLGVDLSLLCFLHVKEEIEQFGAKVLPLVREMEAELPDARPALAQA
jgi:FMNH2-dependent dimethyl sulfone monooxygenase